MGVFSKIGKSIKSFVKSDAGKIALAIGGTAIFGPTVLAKGKSLLAASGSEGLMGIKGRILKKGGETALASIMGGGSSGTSSYGGGSTGYSSLESEDLTTYSPEGSQTVSAPAAADWDAFMNESLQLYAYAETQGRKVT